MAFFNLGAIEQKPKKSAKPKMDGGCDTCPLKCGRYDEDFAGDGKKGILILGDSPTSCEDNGEAVFSSSYFDPLFELEGRDGVSSSILEDCWCGYVVPTQVAKDADTAVYRCCTKRLNSLIRKHKPKVIICVGVWATQVLIGSRLSGRMLGMKPSDFFGKCIPDREYSAWICPTYHPKMFNWTEYKDDRCVPMFFGDHVKNAFSLADEPLPSIPDNWTTYLDADEAAREIERIMSVAEKGHDGVVDVAIDYETTGLKPHRDGHKIVVSSVAWRENGEYHAIGFKWDSNCRQLIDAWYKLTHDDRVKLIAHKCDYEACWTRFRSGLNDSRVDWIPRSNWSWDTCVAAHCIDNTQKVGLKFHTYCELGVLGYDADADEYLQAKDSDPIYGKDAKGKYSCNAYNGLKDNVWVPWEKICEYCAKDSLYTIVLRDIQDNQLGGKHREAYRFLLEATTALAEVQSEGLPVDLGKLEDLKKELSDLEQKAYVEVMSCNEVAMWEKRNPTEKFNPNSGKHIREILYDILKMEPPNGTKDATADTLQKMNLKFCNDILTMRKWQKVKDTFLNDYRKESVWDEEKQTYLIRPFFNLSTGAGGDEGGPRTYRSSSDSPNLQNVPKRDKVMKKMLRNLFVAPPGFRYMEADYRSLEVYISEAYHRDPNMEMYLMNPDANMHTDTACDFYHRTKETLTKEERNTIKAGYVFASFYGASYRSCAQYMWNNMPKYTKEHLQKECGIKTYDHWLEQVRKADDIFWNKRFKVYNEWRKKQWRLYQKQGYLETYFGFRLQGPMSVMQSGNGAIQGTGAHCLLYGMIRNMDEFKERGLKSRIIGEIHDSQVILVAEDEIQEVCRIIWKNSVKACNDAFEWLNLPLVVETDLSDGKTRSWANMTEIGAVSENGCPGLDELLAKEEEDAHIQ